MTIDQSIKAAEAIIFASGDGISFNALQEILQADEKQMQYILDMLKDKYYDGNSGIILVQNSEIISFTTGKDQAEIVHQALAIKKNSPLSNAAMEALAIIAYKQPITRGQIEYIRGVNSDSAVNRLVERGLVEECGRLDAPGRPVLYRTTQGFLRCFGLSTPKDLPELDMSKLSPEYEQLTLEMEENTEIEGQQELDVTEETES